MSDDASGIGDLGPEEFAQLPVASAAHHFLLPAVGAGNLLAGWPYVDRLLRTCWAQHWAHANREQLGRLGHDAEPLVEDLTSDEPASGLWPHFQEVVTRSLRRIVHEAAGDNPEQWGIGSRARVLGVDTELLYVQDLTKLDDGVWRPDVISKVVPMVMRLSEGQWRVLNVGAEIVPEPGWPPRLA